MSSQSLFLLIGFIKLDGQLVNTLSLAFIRHTRSFKQAFANLTVIKLKEDLKICRINAKISKHNYVAIDDLMKKDELISMKLSKGAILDIALSCMFNSLEHETHEALAIQHLSRLEDANVDKALAEVGL